MKKILRKTAAAVLSIALTTGALPAGLCMTANALTYNVNLDSNTAKYWQTEEGSILPVKCIVANDSFYESNTEYYYYSSIDDVTFKGAYYFNSLSRNNDEGTWIAEFVPVYCDADSWDNSIGNYSDYFYYDYDSPDSSKIPFTLEFAIPENHENDTPIGLYCEWYSQEVTYGEYDTPKYEEHHTFSLAYAPDPAGAYFDANGGTGTMDPVLADEVGYFVLPDCTFTPPEGKVFDYWDWCGYYYSAGDTVNTDQALEFKAMWKDKEVAFVSNSITLGGAISLNFYVDFANVPDEYLDDAYVEFYVNNGVQTVPLDRNKMNSKKTAYCFTCMLNSISMADQVHAKLYYFDANGEDAVLDGYASAEDYLRKFNEEDPEKLWNLIKGITDYGYYMQRYLDEFSASDWSLGWDHSAMETHYKKAFDFRSGTNKEKYINTLKAYKKVEDFNSDVKEIKQTLTLDANTDLTLKVALADNYNGSVSMKLDGKKVTPRKLDDGRYQVVISGIAAHKLGETHTLEITTKNGTSTYKVSALSYAYMCVCDPLGNSEFDAMCALYEYYKAAVDYKNQ